MTPLEINGLSKRFGAGGSETSALEDVSLSVASGELVVLLGPSGSGKTTLLRCIAGLIEPSSGTIKLGDRIVADDRERINVPTHKRGLGMVFQNFALWSHMTVRENVAYPLTTRGGWEGGLAKRVDEMLSLVHCAALADRLPSTLSGGQQQRIALARALAASPALLLFDEPLSNLDALLRVELRTQLRSIHRQTGFTGIYVTHDQVEALSLGSRVAVMNGGRIEQIGTPEEIYRTPSTEFVAEFMGMSNRIVVAPDGTRCGGGGERLVQFDAQPVNVRTSNVSIRFRPEAVVLDPAGTTEPARLPATMFTIPDAEVVDRAFTGECTEYSLRAGSLMLKARVVAQTGAPDVGARIRVTVARDGAAFFATAE